jgi:hypothetical protein
MAKCPQTLAGITLDCTTSQGGIKKVWIADYNDVTFTKTGDKISAISTVDKFKPFEFRRGTSTMTSTLTADETTGVNYVTTELSLVFTKMDTAKRIEMAALSIGQLAVIVLDSNGVYWVLGDEDYVSASAGGAETGTAKGDRNAYTITLKTESSTYPYEVEADVVEGLA